MISYASVQEYKYLQKFENKNTHNGLYVEVPPRGTDWKPQLWAKLPLLRFLMFLKLAPCLKFLYLTTHQYLFNQDHFDSLKTFLIKKFFCL
jgi:hypothetical protein